MQTKMMVYDRVVTELNAARLRGTSFPIVHALMESSLSQATDVSALSPHKIIELTKTSRPVLSKWHRTSTFSPK